MKDKVVGILRLAVKADTKDAKKEMNNFVDETEKKTQQMNDNIVSGTEDTNAKIKRLVEERTKIMEREMEKEAKRMGDTTAESLMKIARKPKGDYGGTGDETFYDTESKTYLETPWKLEEILTKQLQDKKQILKVEKDITQEKLKQNTLESSSKGSKFVNSLKGIISKGTSKITSIITGIGSACATIITTIGEIVKIIALVGAIAGPILIVAGIIAGIVALVMRALSMLTTEDKEIKDQIATIKAMIDSIAYTLMPIIKTAVKWVLDMIIAILRLIQHVIYAFTKIDIFKYTGERLKKNMKETANSAKELRKQLAGFDEANILTDSGETKGTNVNDYFKDLDLSIDPNYFQKIQDKIATVYNNIKTNLKKQIKEVEDILADPSQFTKAFGEWDLFFYSITKSYDAFLRYLDDELELLPHAGNFWMSIFKGDWETAWKEVKEIVQLNIDKAWRTLQIFGNNILAGIGIVKGAVLTVYNTVKNKLTELFNYIYNKISPWLQKIVDFITKYFNKKYNLNLDVNVQTQSAKNKITDLLKGAVTVSSILSNNPATIGKTLANLATSAFNTLRNKIGFDTGGIVLPQPGHGVPINAVMSERRAEGIIPLDNPYAMEQLGQSIGKYVNLAIENNMVVDGRVLATATNNRNNKERFLMNG